MHYWLSHAFLSIFISSISFLAISCTFFYLEVESQFSGSDARVPLQSKWKCWYVISIYPTFLFLQQQQQQPSECSEYTVRH